MKEPREMPTSYYLENGDIIFPFNAHTYCLPPWIIMRRGPRQPPDKAWYDDPIKPLSRFYGDGSFNRRYMTDVEAKEALYQYAKKHGLRPAY